MLNQERYTNQRYPIGSVVLYNERTYNVTSYFHESGNYKLTNNDNPLGIIAHESEIQDGARDLGEYLSLERRFPTYSPLSQLNGSNTINSSYYQGRYEELRAKHKNLKILNRLLVDKAHEMKDYSEFLEYLKKNNPNKHREFENEYFKWALIPKSDSLNKS